MLRETDPVFVALGSNLGDRRENIGTAIDMLRSTDGFDVVRVADLYESEPMYVVDQPSFMNTALSGHCSLAPGDLLKRLKEIEVAVGRQKTFVNGPRVVDLDIVYFGAETVETEGLSIPHPRRLERDFVLRPIAQIAPDFVDPATSRTVADHLRDLAESAA